MASATATKKMREEATCSICLELMTEPMSIDCGHSFCRQCIEDILENLQVMSSLRDPQCPLCRAPFQRQSLRSNKQLENLIQTVKEIDREKLCEEHGEQLRLFCEDDGQLICWLCERSPEHRGHRTALMKDVCPGYKNSSHLSEDPGFETQNWSFSGRVIFLASDIKKLREEATCSICQQLMRDPVSIRCGHTFCRLCIEDDFQDQHHIVRALGFISCPQCCIMFSRATMHHNEHVERLLEYITTLCEEHGDPLHLFCEDDGHPICWRCTQSPQHREHNTALVEDVYPGYKEELQEVLTKLTALQGQCRSWALITREQIEEWEEKTELQKQKIQCDFEKLHIFLREKENYYLQELEKEKNQTLNTLRDSEASLAKQNDEIDSHILELEKKCQGSAQKLLQDVKDTLSRSSAVKLEVPEAISLELYTECDFSKVCSDMKKTFLAPDRDGSVVKHSAHQGPKGVGLGPEMNGCSSPQNQLRLPPHFRIRRLYWPPREQSHSGSPSTTASSTHPSTAFSPCQEASQEETQ
ncbi:E3 ubiquitin-protein ligase TRIM38-like [Talpa occidentalis]|uniref:E3 ubiquitin-protein ligase TRIM38-like n=1 Tax=Talpa occidentalis TaxID=50954 RepID=UPI00188EDD43|nr:E3 ubiquitin-protein ligase TRIM38-like [Talpa occidentalis]XP_037374863.1 E3 ubiquitin-protein ligase TRIM38-like [Talpa occidentalis]